MLSPSGAPTLSMSPFQVERFGAHLAIGPVDQAFPQLLQRAGPDSVLVLGKIHFLEPAIAVGSQTAEGSGA